MAPINQQSTPSMAEMFSELQNLTRPAQETFRRDMQAAQAIKPIDPSILQTALAEGGPLSTAQDFATSSAWAMTPEMFKSAIAARPDVTKQISDVTTLSDAIFNRSGMRKASEEVAKSDLGMASKAAEMANRGFGDQLDRTVRAEEGKADRLLRESQFSRSLAVDKARMAEAARHNRVVESRQAAYQKFLSGQAGASAKGIPDDPQWAKSLDDSLKLQNPDFWTSDKQPRIDMGAVGDYATSKDTAKRTDAVNFMNIYMQRQALGQPTGKVYNSGFMKEAWGNWPQLYLTPLGWYGIETDGGKIIRQSQQPVVSMFNAPKGSSRGAGGSTLYPVYPGAGE